ncbi:MAG: LamG domain-containing protein [Candidatus Shapirobacteria bacterium]|jgi:hypothetical protein
MVQQPLDKVEKFSYKTLITIVVILLIGIVALIRIQQKPTSVLAEWFNDAWMYRQAINISTHSVGETNVYISTSVNIGTTAKSQSDNGDFRFTTSSGQLLDYYIVSGAGTTNISFHINFDSFPAGAQTVYAYYGNPSADNGFSNSDFSTVASSYSIGSPVTEEIGGGPVAWYKFDEGTGTTAFDSSTGNNNGSLNTGNSSPSWLTSDQCISGNCLSFDGNDNINLGDNSIQEFSDGTNFTISLWIRSPLTSTGTILAKKTSTTAGTSGYDIRLASTGTLDVYFSDGTDQFQLTKTSAITANTWTHFVIIFDNNSTSNTDIYINGAKSNASQTGTLGNINDIGVNTQSLRVGSESDSQDFIVAIIDEIKLYSYARSVTQIRQDFTSSNTGQSSANSSVNIGGNSAKGLSDGLVGYWKFEEGVGSTSADSSGNSRTLTFGSGTSAPSWIGGKFGIGTSFGGNDYITGQVIPLGADKGTISAWINMSSIPAVSTEWYSIIMRNYQEEGFDIQNDAGTVVAFFRSAGGSVCSTSYSTSLAANTWYHLIGTTDGKTQKVYINGVLSNTCNVTTGNWTAEASTWGIGTHHATDPGHYFKGTIDEVKLYNRALSSTDVKNLYNYAPGPVGYWKFDEKSGTTAYDSSGKSHNSSSFNGSPTWITGKVGSALDFESSSNQWVNIPDSDEHDMVKNDFSVCLWLNPETTGPEFAGAFEHRDNTSPNLGYELRWDALSQMEFMLDLGATTVKIQSNPLTVGNWYYICSIASRNGTAKIYQDGKLIESQDISAYYSVGISSPDSTYIGTVNNSASFDFDGKIDDVKLYNYARTQEQVLQDMQGDSNTSPRNGKPAIYYKFDESNGSTTSNWGIGGTVNGTLATGNSSPSWVDGKNNKGLSFSANDYLSVGTTVNNIQSVSFWIKPSGITNNHFFSLSPTVAIGATGNTLFASGFTSPTISINGISTSTLTDNTWQHVVVSIGTTVTGSAINIGKNSTNYFSGVIDDFKLFNYQLSQDEIKTDLNQNSSFTFGSSNQTIGATTTSLDYCVPGDTSPCSPPVANWKLDEKAGTSAKDTSGNNNDSTTWTGTNTWILGKFGSGINFNNNDGVIRFAETTTTTDIGNNNSYTVETWFKTTDTSASTDSLLAKHGTNSGASPFRLYLSATTRTPGITLRDGVTGFDVTGPTPLNNGQWHHLVGVRDFSADKAYLYVDGVLVNTGNDITTGSIANNDDISIGNARNSYLVDDFNGAIDEVRIYDYARTPAQIAYDYNHGGPTGWWKMDECQGTQIADWSGLANHGTLTVGASGSQTTPGTCSVGTSAAWTNGASGKMNSSISLDGSDDSINIGMTVPTIEGATEASVCSWLKYRPSSVTTDGAIVSRYLGSLGGWLLWVDDSAALSGRSDTVSFAVDPGADASGRVEGSTGLVTTGQWDHYCGVFKGGSYIRLYKNGVLNTEQTSSIVSVVDTDNANFYIGRVDNASPRYLDGQVDDVRVYNYALTETQIKSVYNGSGVNFR